jgi:hypothetical protein
VRGGGPGCRRGRRPARPPALPLFQEGHPGAGAPPWVGPREGGPRRRAEGAEDIARAAPPIVDCLARATGWRGVRPNRLPARVARGAEGAPFVQADHPASRRRGAVARLDPPLFSANSGSPRAPNQGSCRRPRQPSRSRISSIRLRRMAIPLRACRHAASRSSVPEANGRSRLRGLGSAAALTAATASAEWVAGRPERWPSSRAARASAVQRRMRRRTVSASSPSAAALAGGAGQGSGRAAAGMPAEGCLAATGTPGNPGALNPAHRGRPRAGQGLHRRGFFSRQVPQTNRLATHSVSPAPERLPSYRATCRMNH